MLINLLLGFFVVLSAGLNTLAQTLLKIGADQSPFNLYLLGGLFTYGLSSIFYIAVLSKFNLSIAYPLVIGLTVVAATMMGAFFFREKVAVEQWVGIGLVLSGIFAIAFRR